MERGVILTINNKEKEISKTFFDAFLKCYKNIRICLVNNGSTDGTDKLLEEIQKRFPNNIFVLHIRNIKSDELALKAGFRYLLSKGKGEVSQVTLSNQLDLDELNIIPDFG
ncbi:glycosyltransferase [uncultured Lutibacter sp.]|uniref:glycosyltransferase n=1 Tax=uncultured Lutibacter sp. TaxID=437739 RepID=UPI002631E219|nr:glycosyltransferase [uncultured Lutibacter sp.]